MENNWSQGNHVSWSESISISILFSWEQLHCSDLSVYRERNAIAGCMIVIEIFAG